MKIWKPIAGFDGYEISDSGEVRCWNSQNGKGEKLDEPRLLKPSKFAGKPYMRVTLSRNGERCQRRLHHLVLEAFVGPCPDGMEACHGLAGAEDNSLANLRWDTHQANMDDQTAHGTRVRGEKVSRARITEEQARQIKAALAVETGYGSMTRVAEMVGVPYKVVVGIKQGITWRHV